MYFSLLLKSDEISEGTYNCQSSLENRHNKPNAKNKDLLRNTFDETRNVFSGTKMRYLQCNFGYGSYAFIKEIISKNIVNSI